MTAMASLAGVLASNVLDMCELVEREVMTPEEAAEKAGKCALAVFLAAKRLRAEAEQTNEGRTR